MRYFLILLLTILISNSANAQYDYASSPENPFGKLNPNAPKEVGEYSQMIGISNCTSENRATDGSWNDPVSMEWTFKYILNGMAVQDRTLKEDGSHGGSIRQFNPDSSSWFVHWFSSNSAPSVLSSWKGSKNDEDNIVLYRKQAAPNGLDGFYRLTFSDISNDSFEWIGEWVNIDESIVYPTWKISCRKS